MVARAGAAVAQSAEAGCALKAALPCAMKLYDHPASGNGYKVRLLLAQLGTQYDCVPIDLLAGEARSPEFLGKVPVLELDDGRTLPESNAILYTHLAREGGIDVEPFAAIREWLVRVRSQPRHIGMEQVAR